MEIYTSNEKYTIWTDEKRLCYIQMAGGEIEDVGYNTAIEAMEAAEVRK
jgi:hypothetical protein